MIPTVAVTAAFPVPTASNPDAIFRKEKLVEIATSGGDQKKGSDESTQLRLDLAKARNDNRAKVSEDYRRREDLEACKKKWRATQAAQNKEEKKKELELLGLPESCAYLLDTAQFAMKHHQMEASSLLNQEEDQIAATYEKAVKRIIGDGSNAEGLSGAERLKQDLHARAEKNAKRAKLERTANAGVNLENAQFLKAVDKSINKDARAQIIKQNLERGTAL